VTLVGERHYSPAAKNHWAPLSSEIAEGKMKVYVEGLASNHEASAHIYRQTLVKAEEFTDSAAAHLLGMEDVVAYSFGYILRGVEAYWMYHHLRQQIPDLLATYEAPQITQAFLKQEITQDSKRWSILALQIEELGVPYLWNMLNAYYMSKDQVLQSFDRSMWTHLLNTLTVATFSPVLDRSLRETSPKMGDLFTPLEGGAGLYSALKESKYTELAQLLFSSAQENNAQTLAAWFGFSGAWMLEFARQATASQFDGYAQFSSLIPSTLVDDVENYFSLVKVGSLEQLAFKEKLLIHWRNRVFAHVVGKAYCESYRSSDMRPIFMKVGSGHVDDLRTQLAPYLPEGALIQTQLLND